MSENTSNDQTGQVGGGSGSSGGAGAGGLASNPNNPNLAGSGSANIVDLSEDSMVRLPGAKDPVRYGDHYRTFQSEFTKRSQENARLKQEVAQARQREADYQRRLQNNQGDRGGQAQPAPFAKLSELAESLKSLTYLDGAKAAAVVEGITSHFAAMDQALQQRDLALGLMYKRMQAMAGVLGGLHNKHSSTEFEGKINRFVKDAGLPERANRWAQELYLAYEGDDLDQEFPRILKERWEEVTGLIEDSRKARVEAARQRPFVPGQGGNGSAGAKLQNIKSASARDLADAFWPGGSDSES